VDAGDNTFQCIDAFHQKNALDSWVDTTIDIDEFQNCYIVKSNEEGKTEVIEVEVNDETTGLKRTIANFTVHFNRPFRSENLDGEDVAIYEG